MNALAVKAALATLIAATTLATPQAQAADVLKVTMRCMAGGGFGGNATLSYVTDGVNDKPQSISRAAGPYIGDSGTQQVRIYYRDATGSLRDTYKRLWTGLRAGESTSDLPASAQVPHSALAWVEVRFTGGSYSCTAKAEIK